MQKEKVEHIEHFEPTEHDDRLHFCRNCESSVLMKLQVEENYIYDTSDS